MSPELRYRRYVLWCIGMDILPARFEIWTKTQRLIAETKIVC
jgi:hypothetical protein